MIAMNRIESVLNSLACSIRGQIHVMRFDTDKTEILAVEKTMCIKPPLSGAVELPFNHESFTLATEDKYLATFKVLIEPFRKVTALSIDLPRNVPVPNLKNITQPNLSTAFDVLILIGSVLQFVTSNNNKDTYVCPHKLNLPADYNTQLKPNVSPDRARFMEPHLGRAIEPLQCLNLK